MKRNCSSRANGSVAAVLPLILAAIASSGCAIERVNFDAYLDRSVGRSLSDVDFDLMLSGVGGRQLIGERDEVQTYRFTLPKSSCAWEVDVQKKSRVILRWRYISDEARGACNDLPASRGV